MLCTFTLVVGRVYLSYLLYVTQDFLLWLANWLLTYYNVPNSICDTFFLFKIDSGTQQYLLRLKNHKKPDKLIYAICIVYVNIEFVFFCFISTLFKLGCCSICYLSYMFYQYCCQNQCLGTNCFPLYESSKVFRFDINTQQINDNKIKYLYIKQY